MARRSSFTNEIVLQLASSCDETSAENDLEIVMARANCFARPNSDRSPLYDVRNHACCSIRSGACETVLSSRTGFDAHVVRDTTIWWSQTGSNRRPHACKARALPAELWPRTRRRMRQAVLKRASDEVVGLGRLELPTSRLSSARSNQLSYKPLTTRGRMCSHPR